ncbi:MAG: chorismate synthase [Victivallaceae bacterium]|nr:chorismate synthase [Victivallaceae bacterium]
MSSSLGEIFKVTTFGESHGPAIGAVVDGMLPGIPLNEEIIQRDLDRRRPGQSKLTTARGEADRVEILSGVFEGVTTGTPVALLIRNCDSRSSDYGNLAELFRPGHADYTYFRKYGVRDYRGGGRSSGRETAARVAAGAVAKALLGQNGIDLFAYTAAVGSIRGVAVNRDCIEKNPVRAADPDAVEAMTSEILSAAKEHDSVGGIVECQILHVPAGLGEPVFDKLDALLGQAILSIGGIKGIEFGDGFAAASLRGSRNNDQMTPDGFATNHAGGILGGISSGAPIIFRAAVKPTPSVGLPQRTVTKENCATVCEIAGRHDPCLCPRIVPVVEAMAALVIADALLLSKRMD